MFAHIAQAVRRVPRPAFTVDLVLSIAYNGYNFCGFQSQGAAIAASNNPVRTVEDQLLMGLRAAFGSVDVPRSLQAVSRTDTGVSARQQIVRTVLPLEAVEGLGVTPDEEAAFIARFNQHLPWDIRIVRLRFTRPSQIYVKSFGHVKSYSYYFGESGEGAWLAGAPLDKVAFIVHNNKKPLDIGAMGRALKALEGTHSFQYFSAGKDARETAKPGQRRVKAPRLQESGKGDAAPHASSGAGAVPHKAEDDDDGDSEDSEGQDESGVGGVSERQARAEAGVRTVSSVRLTRMCPWSLAAASAVGTPPPEEIPGCVEWPLPGYEEEGSGRASSEAAACRCAPASCAAGCWMPRDWGKHEVMRGGVTSPACHCEGEAATGAPAGGSLVGPLRVWRVRFTGNGFLKHQLRRIMGAAMAIGQGKLPEDFFAKTLAAADAAVLAGSVGQQCALEPLPAADVTLAGTKRRAEEAGDVEGAQRQEPGHTKGSGAPKTLADAAVAAAAAAAGPETTELGGWRHRPAPGRGLCLERIYLPPGFWDDPDYSNNRLPRYWEDWKVKPAAPWVHPDFVTLPPLGSSGNSGGSGGGSSSGAPPLPSPLT